MKSDTVNDAVNKKLTQLLKGCTYNDVIYRHPNGASLIQRFYVKDAKLPTDKGSVYTVDKSKQAILLNTVTFTDMEEPVYIEIIAVLEKSLFAKIDKIKRGELFIDNVTNEDVVEIVEKDIGCSCLDSI